VQVKVLQGEREMAADNKLLGEFDLVGIPPAPRGVPQIEVSFVIDADGILHVTAKDKATGKEQRIVIQSSGGLSKDAIERMIKEAEANQAADAKRRESIEARNEIDSLIHSVTKSLNEHKAKLDDATVATIQKAIDDAKAIDEKAELETIKAASSALSSAALKIGEVMYKKDGASGEASASSSEDKSADSGKAQDAEFKEKENK
jgi:molecular chaperone DnaK